MTFFKLDFDFLLGDGKPGTQGRLAETRAGHNHGMSKTADVYLDDRDDESQNWKLFSAFAKGDIGCDVKENLGGSVSPFDQGRFQDVFYGTETLATFHRCREDQRRQEGVRFAFPRLAPPKQTSDQINGMEHVSLVATDSGEYKVKAKKDILPGITFFASRDNYLMPYLEIETNGRGVPALTNSSCRYCLRDVTSVGGGSRCKCGLWYCSGTCKNRDSSRHASPECALFQHAGAGLVTRLRRLVATAASGATPSLAYLQSLLTKLFLVLDLCEKASPETLFSQINNFDRMRPDVAAWAVAVPFLRPGDVPRIEDSSVPYQDGIALLYTQALAHAQQLRQPGQALIAMGHCHMVGGQISSDSERSIVIGGSEALPSGMFDAQVAYAALGHLHLAQRVGGQHHLRYCGSPLPLSFAEVAYPHQVLRVDLQGDTVSAITPLQVPRAVDLLRVPAQPAPLPDVLAALKVLALPEQTDPQRHPYLEVRVRLDAPEPGLRSQIEAALAPHAVRLAKIETSFAASAGTAGTAAHTSLDALEQLQPAAVFDQLYRSKYNTDTPAALSAAFAELLLADDMGDA